MVKSYFGDIEGDYVLYDLTCAGSESNLASCDHAGTGPHYCADGNQAGVICHNPGKGYIIINIDSQHIV